MKLLLDPASGQSGGGGADWKASLPEDLRGASVLANVPDVQTLVKNYVNAESLIGKKRVPIPDKNWGDKEYEEFHTAIGRPATPDKYAEPDLKFEEGFAVDKERLEKYKMQFHKLGLTERQAKGLMEAYLSDENDRFKSTKTGAFDERSKAEEAMKKEFGDKYQQKVDMAIAAVKKFDTDTGEFSKFLNETKLGNHPALVKVFSKIAEKFGEDSTGNPGGGMPIPDKTRAKNEIDTLKTDKDFMAQFMSGSKPAVARWNELHRLAYS
jgi:hypothetical protein